MKHVRYFQGWWGEDDDIFKEAFIVIGWVHIDTMGVREGGQPLWSVSCVFAVFFKLYLSSFLSLFLTSPIKARLSHTIFGIRTSLFNSYISYILVLFFGFLLPQENFSRQHLSWLPCGHDIKTLEINLQVTLNAIFSSLQIITCWVLDVGSR